MKEWLSVAHPANGVTNVTVSIVDGNLAVKWTVKCYGDIKAGVREGREHARRAMADLQEVSSDA